MIIDMSDDVGFNLRWYISYFWMQPNYSYNEPNVQSSYNQPTTEGRKSFVDNKPMIQGLVRSVLKI